MLRVRNENARENRRCRRYHDDVEFCKCPRFGKYLFARNVDGEKNIVLSGFAQNVFRVGKEAGVLRDENDFRDLELRDDDDDGEKKKHNSPYERIFTAACFKTGSDRDVFVGAANGEVSAYAHRSSHIE